MCVIGLAPYIPFVASAFPRREVTQPTAAAKNTFLDIGGERIRNDTGGTACRREGRAAAEI
jgi:hypothetical protein